MTTRTLGVNGFGRIGKLTLWYHLGGDQFDRLVVNLGREVGANLSALVEYFTKDSTYGPLHRYLEGRAGRPDMQVLDEAQGLFRVHGKEVLFLREQRDPRLIPWRQHGVQLVVDCTGKFSDPTKPADDSKGALRGHLESGARVVILSAPFKGTSNGLPADAAILINGINHWEFDAQRHRVVSAASCTTTALAHMVRPLLDRDVTSNVLTASMSTVHATTNSQTVLDNVPKAGAKDLRKTRSVLNNIILTSTGAARALEMVMPEIGRIGFMADSVRVPLTTGSLIILNATFQTEVAVDGRPAIDRALINRIYRETAETQGQELLVYSEEQNVSADVVGRDAAVVIEAAETHTRTGFIHLQLPADLQAATAHDRGASSRAGVAAEGEPALGMGERAERGARSVGTEEVGPGGDGGELRPAGNGLESGFEPAATAFPELREVRVPVTHAKIFGWYDNELGSYTGRLGELTAHVASNL